VRRAYESVEAAYAKQGVAPQWPVSLVVENMPIMGATQSRVGVGHLIHVSLRAARSDMLAGLVAHEMGHIARTEARHPSHNPAIHDRAIARVSVPAGFRRGFPRLAHAAINHVEDIYADGYAIAVIGTDRTRSFFAEWVGNAAATAAAGTRWDEVTGALDIAFSLGNLARHGLLPADDPLRREAKAFAKAHGIESLDALTALFRDLPDPVSDAGCEEILVTLLETTVRELRKVPA
jgi:hypothetical protein